MAHRHYWELHDGEQKCLGCGVMKRHVQRPRTNKKVINALEQALRIADYTLRQKRGCGVAEVHQEAMRLYLDTWCAAPLREVIEFLKGDIEAHQFSNWN